MDSIRFREKVIKGRGAVGKTAVHGVVQRSVGDDPSQVRASVIGSETAQSLLREVRAAVAPGSQVYTDSAHAYGDLCLTHFHGTVNHEECYVDGDAHTNTAENFWSLLKRALKGTYIHVEPFHLFRYVEEQAFRFNNRLKSDFQRFHQALRQVVGKRLTYRQLAAIGDTGFMGIE